MTERLNRTDWTGNSLYICQGTEEIEKDAGAWCLRMEAQE